MELSYVNADALVRAIGGASGEHLGAFVGSLIGKQYSVSYVCQLAQHAQQDVTTAIAPIITTRRHNMCASGIVEQTTTEHLPVAVPSRQRLLAEPGAQVLVQPALDIGGQHATVDLFVLRDHVLSE